MTENPTTVAPNSTVSEALGTMREFDVRHLPVVDAGEMVGILSDRDLRNFTEWYLFDEQEQSELRERLGTAISEVMSTEIFSVDPEGELAEAIDLMLTERVGAIPVVDTRTRQLVGIVSYVDALRALRPQA